MPIAVMSNTLGDLLKREFSTDYCRETAHVEPRDEGYPLGSVLGRKSTGIYCLSIAESVEAADGVTPSDGEEDACAVLLQEIEPGDELEDAVVLARGPVIVAEAGLFFDESVTDALKPIKHQQLAAHGIVVRQSV